MRVLACVKRVPMTGGRIVLTPVRIQRGDAVRAKLAQLYPARGGALPAGLVEALMRRAQGNPFYLEELLNYVRDRGLDPSDIQNIELPDSLHTLILSRIDQLSEREKTTLRVASIIGRLFRAAWLAGAMMIVAALAGRAPAEEPAQVIQQIESNAIRLASLIAV